jgi:hypothetical protein
MVKSRRLTWAEKGEKDAYRILVGKPLRKCPIGRERR